MEGDIPEKGSLYDTIIEEVASPEERLESLEKSLEIFSKFNYLPEMIAGIFLKMGEVHIELKNNKNAFENYQIALNLYSDEKHEDGQGYALAGLGKLAHENRRYSESRGYYTGSLKMFKASDNHEMERLISQRIAETYHDEGYLDDAINEYDKLAEPHSSEDYQGLHFARIRSLRLKRKLFELKPSVSQIVLLISYLIIFAGSELLIAYNYLEIGLYIHILIIPILIINSALTSSPNFSNLLRSMVIVPMIRVVGLSVPILNIEPIYWYVLVSVALFAAGIILIKNQNLSRKSVGLVFGNIPVQLTVALTGLAFGYIEYQILKPNPLISSFTIETALLAAFILILSTGLAEELIYRGIIQKDSENVLGKMWGLLYASLIFVSLHIGWNSDLDLIFVLFISIFYGYVFQKTRSIFGISLSHGLTNILLFIVMPFLII